MAEISVIIPVFNTEAFLEECLCSVIHQTFRNFEAIIVDDGSTDNSLELAKKIVGDDTRFKIIHQKNQGLSGARNTGLNLATAPWVTFIDSDDAWNHDFLATVLGLVKNCNASIGCSGKKSFQKFTTQSSKKYSKDKIQVFTPIEALQSALYQKDKPDYSAWNKIYKTELWKGIQFPEGIFFEDFATIPKIFRKAQKIAFVNTPLYLYRKRTTSILATSYTPKKAELLSIAEENYGLCKEDPNLRAAAESMLLSASFSIIMRTSDSIEYQEIRQRAWNWIVKFRLQAILDRNTRMRNKIAAVFSYMGKSLFQRFFSKVSK